MSHYQKTKNLSASALHADMDPKTARKYIAAGKMPSELRSPHTWRTREDPFEEDWPQCAAMLAEAPELQAKTVFEWLCEQSPGKYQEGQLRTFQRKVRMWRAKEGPEKEVFFPQDHTPGRRMSTDFTDADKLEVTICGEPFSHKLCHCVLTCSNWEWASICFSESMLSLQNGLQNALFQLGRIPREHWTDHSSAATHKPAEGSEAAKAGADRAFNPAYLDLMRHFELQPRTIQVDSPHENGDVESLNGALKSRLNQHLLLRGSRDFDSVEEYRFFLEEVLHKANARRSERLAKELDAMRLLKSSRLAEYKTYRCKVHRSSTFSVDRRIYSAPSRLIGEQVEVRRYETRIEVSYKGTHQFTAPWIPRGKEHHINYRHVVGWLLRKSGAFAQYRYRQDLFPGTIFRWAYDQLLESCSERTAEREYLQLLNHAATTMECAVKSALGSCKADGVSPRFDTVLSRCPRPVSVLPELEALRVDLNHYDHLLGAEKRSA